MQKSTKDFLRKIDKNERRELGMALNLADSVAIALIKYKINKKDFIKKMGITARNLTDMLNGTYPFDLRIIALYNTVINEYIEKQSPPVTIKQ